MFRCGAPWRDDDLDFGGVVDGHSDIAPFFCGCSVEIDLMRFGRARVGCGEIPREIVLTTLIEVGAYIELALPF